MANIIKIKSSAEAGRVPSGADLVQGELALNTADSVLWAKDSAGVVKQVGKQVSADFIHDSLEGFVEEEHIDWTTDQGAVDIHNGNYTDTTYSVGDGGLTQNNFTNDDHTKLDGIATSANNYSLPLATTTARGGIELFNDTDQTVAANAVSTTASRTYGIQLNSDNQAVVNVPWSDTDTDTVYTHPTNHAISVITGLQTALDSKVTEDASSTTLVGAITTVIFSMPLATYRSAKLMITAKQGTKYETLELTVLHDGTNSFHNEFGLVYNDVDFVTLTTDVSGADVRVLALTDLASTIKVDARKQSV